jgi:hypothetical protein
VTKAKPVGFLSFAAAATVVGALPPRDGKQNCDRTSIARLLH